MPDNKPAFRQQLKTLLRAMAPADRLELSRRAADLLLQTPQYASARTLMLFVSMSSEIDTAAVIEHAWSTGRRVLVPRAHMEDRSMEAVEIRSRDQAMQSTRIGVSEPAAGLVVPPGEIDLVVVPGLGFGPRGERLGRGAGFYDRFLGDPALHAVRCGYAFEQQVLEGIPMTEHDTPLHMLVTDAKVRYFATGRSL